MTGAREGVVQDRREPSVHPQPIFAELLVEDRGEERVRESDCPVVALDHLRGDGGIECAGGDTGPTENSLRGRPERRGQGEGITRRRGKAVDPRAHELLQGLRNREVRRGSTSASSACASSSAKNGFPPERSWMRSNVWRPNALPRRSRRSRCSAPTLSGPIGTRWICSEPKAPSSSEGMSASATRRASKHETLVPVGRRSANASALDDDGSSHCTSSTAISNGDWSLSNCRAPRTATATARRSTGRRAIGSRSKATSSAYRRGGGKRREHLVENVLEEIA